MDFGIGSLIRRLTQGYKKVLLHTKEQRIALKAHIEPGEMILLRYPQVLVDRYPEKIETYSTNGTNSLLGNLSRAEAIALLHASLPKPE